MELFVTPSTIQFAGLWLISISTAVTVSAVTVAAAMVVMMAPAATVVAMAPAAAVSAVARAFGFDFCVDFGES